MKKAKYLVVLLVAAAFLMSFTVNSFAESIGFIEVAKVFKEYKETAKAEEQLKSQKDEYEKKFKDAQENLDKAEKDKKSVDEVEKMRKELESDLEPKRQALLKLNEELTTRLQGDILASVKKVAKKVGIDIVLDKQAIINGGVDLTEMVINDLNKK